MVNPCTGGVQTGMACAGRAHAGQWAPKAGPPRHSTVPNRVARPILTHFLVADKNAQIIGWFYTDTSPISYVFRVSLSLKITHTDKTRMLTIF